MSLFAERAARWLSIWFGCGLSPKAPGTVGTLGALPLYWLLARGGTVTVALGAAVITLLGVWAAGRVARQTGLPDPQIVVIDEVAGVLTALSFAAPTPLSVAAAVLLFRLFDIWKPGPVRYFEQNLPGGWGIVMDDIAAGLCAGALTFGLQTLIWN